MLAEMSATELDEWRIRANLQAEVDNVQRRAELTYEQAHNLVFKKYTT